MGHNFMNSCLLNTLLDIFRSSIFQTFFYLLAKRKWQILAAKHLQLRYLKSTSRSSAWYFKEELNQLNSITYHYIFNYYQILSIPFARATFSIPYFIPSRAEVYVSSKDRPGSLFQPGPGPGPGSAKSAGTGILPGPGL